MLFSPNYDRCFECQRRKVERCIVMKSQLRQVRAGERLAVHFAVSGLGSTSVTGVLGEPYEEDGPSVVIRVGGSDFYCIGVDLI